MITEAEVRARRRDLSTHILGASVVMIGVSTTLIGLVKIAKSHPHVDQYAGLTGLLFLFSAGAAYVSLRYGNYTNHGQRWEQAADVLFIIGLVSISMISTFFAYEII